MTTKIIDGKRYNTETATLVAEWSNGLSYSDFRHCDEALYRTPKGNWFTCGSGGPLSSYAKWEGNSGRGQSDVIRAISEADAKEWLERHKETAALEKHFPDQIEDA